MEEIYETGKSKSLVRNTLLSWEKCELQKGRKGTGEKESVSREMCESYSKVQRIKYMVRYDVRKGTREKEEVK